ncbi:MAG: hypothetical protein LBQ93_04310 [Treponema sp.]|jgi:hypothetical protein|nr:hypothetical protein [Treponema sp.]
MRLIVLSFVLFFSLFLGCKSVPKQVLPEVEPPAEVEAPSETFILTEDEIKIINEVNDHVLTLITRELRIPRDDMQVCINNEFYLYRLNSTGSYETDLKNSENFLKNEMKVNNEIILSFINRNNIRKNVDKNVKFKADFFWKGGIPRKSYFKILFSSIGFDADNTKALVHIFVDLPNWVFTEYVYLEKRNENWTYINSRLY